MNIRTNVRTYVLTYKRTGQTLYPLHNFVVRGDKYCLNQQLVHASHDVHLFIWSKGKNSSANPFHSNSKLYLRKECLNYTYPTCKIGVWALEWREAKETSSTWASYSYNTGFYLSAFYLIYPICPCDNFRKSKKLLTRLQSVPRVTTYHDHL